MKNGDKTIRVFGHDPFNFISVYRPVHMHCGDINNTRKWRRRVISRGIKSQWRNSLAVGEQQTVIFYESACWTIPQEPERFFGRKKSPVPNSPSPIPNT
jgi:hypothetical protein